MKVEKFPTGKASKIKYLMKLADMFTEAYINSGFMGICYEKKEVHLTPPEFFNLFGDVNYEYVPRDDRDMPYEVMTKVDDCKFYCLMSGYWKCSDLYR